MTPEHRMSIARWIAGIGILTAVGLLWPDIGQYGANDWAALSSAAALIALAVNLGVDTAYGTITFVPVIVLAVYHAFGLKPALSSTSLGLLIGGAAFLTSSWNRLPEKKWWAKVASLPYEIGRSGLSLLAADWANRNLYGQNPLIIIPAFSALLPLVISLLVYLIVYDLIILGDLRLRGISIKEAIQEDRITTLAIQLLPLGLAPFAAITYAQLGILAFGIFELVIFTVVIVVNRLTLAQDRLSERVAQLQSISTMNQLLRTGLELDSLLQTVYLQIASLLKVDNICIVLGKPGISEPLWQPRLICENGRTVERPESRKVDGFSNWVMENGQSLIAESVGQKAQELSISPPPNARSWMGIPLIASRRTMGSLSIWIGLREETGRVFTDKDFEVFSTIAAQTEVSLENALLYAEAQQQAIQLSQLNKISTVLNAALNPEKLLELIAESVVDISGCAKSAIYLLENESEHPSLILTQAKGFSSEHYIRSRDIAVPLTSSERENILEDGVSVIVPDIGSEDADISAAALLLARREKFTAYAYLPLRGPKRIIGMLAVYYDQPHTFPDTERELLDTFANQAALAITNARIYQQVDIQLTRRNDQLENMLQLSRQLSSSLDLDRLFKLIVDSAIEGCGAGAGVLVLAGNPELGTRDIDHPHMVAWRGFDPSNLTRAPHMIAEELANSEVLQEGETRLLSTDDPVESSPRSQLSVPIFLENDVIGAIVLESEVYNAFNQEDVNYVNQLAVQAAVAIRNAQLYRRSQAVSDRLHAILDTTNDGLVMFDPHLRIIMTNTRMSEFWDFARQDSTAPSPDQFIADPTSVLSEGLGYKEGELKALVRRGIQNPNMSPGADLYLSGGSGGKRRRFVERTATPVRDDGGNFIGLLLMFRDVTDQKELEETRQNFTSMIVHDLRSPLQAVMGSMRLISEVKKGDDPVIEQATEVSQRAVKKLLNLVNNLLDLSRMEQGEQVMDSTFEKLSPILKNAVEEVMPLAREMDAVIQVEVPEDLPYTRIDRDMIGRVVINLLDNALKYSEPGTLVKLTAALRPADEKARQEQPMLAISVIDHGPGVPDEYKEQIFDRYSMIPGRKGRRSSTGLGLAFCRLAIDSHKGRIWVENNPEGGSIFCFTLPVEQPPPEPDDGPKTDGPPAVSDKKPEAVDAPEAESDKTRDKPD